MSLEVPKPVGNLPGSGLSEGSCDGLLKLGISGMSGLFGGSGEFGRGPGMRIALHVRARVARITIVRGSIFAIARVVQVRVCMLAR